MIRIDVNLDGPIFNGLAELAASDAADAIRKALAEKGEQRVKDAFNARIRVNRGIFIGTITTIGSSRVMVWVGPNNSKTYTMPVVVADPATDLVVTSELATYSPWLQGSGSRNFPVTRFPGYHGFRIAAQELDLEAEVIAERVIKPYIVAMNG